ncbi:MAG: protein rep [Microbacterium sp.]
MPGHFSDDQRHHAPEGAPFAPGAGEARGGSKGAPHAERSDAPWYIANNVAASDWRRVRFRRRQRSSGWLIGHAREQAGLSRDARADASGEWVRPLRPARCRWRAAAAVTVHADGTGEHPAHYSGLERCASVWACPVCAGVIRATRADEIERAALHAQDAGMRLAFMTLTLRHRSEDGLAPSIDVLLGAWRSLQSWRAWKQLAARLGYVGAIRSTEVTYGGNGWHPHSHFLVVFERPLSAAELASFQAEVHALWVRAVEKKGGRLPSREHGVKVQAVDGDGAVLANYLSKVQEHAGERRTSVGAEIARGDLKRGRGDSLAPFELLDAEGPGTEQARALWVEFVTATRGRRAFSWTKGLRDRLLPGEEEKTDDELIEEAEAFEPVAVIEARTYDRAFRNNADRLAEALEIAESGDLDRLAWYVRVAPDPSPPSGERVRFNASD